MKTSQVPESSPIALADPPLCVAGTRPEAQSGDPAYHARPRSRSTSLTPGASDVGRSVYVELSHEIEDGLVTYPGLPPARICDYLSRENSRSVYAHGTEFQIARIDMVANTGTYLDAPYHRFPDGKDLCQISPADFCDLDAIVVRADHREVRSIDTSWLQDLELEGRAVLIHTGWDIHWRESTYGVEHPHLTHDAAEYLRERRVKLVGIDSMNIDSTDNGDRPVHTVLLGAGILIVEHLCNLGSVPDTGFWFSAMPPKVRGAGTFPVRAIARVGRL
nr:cyclase family protein [Pseudoxanthomonas sp.]